MRRTTNQVQKAHLKRGVKLATVMGTILISVVLTGLLPLHHTTNLDQSALTKSLDKNYPFPDLQSSFELSTSPNGDPPTYPVVFNETGLLPRVPWSVTMNGVVESSTNSSLVFNEPKGTYPFVVSTPYLYGTTQASGVVTVTGVATNVTGSFPPNFYASGISEPSLLAYNPSTGFTYIANYTNNIVVLNSAMQPVEGFGFGSGQQYFRGIAVDEANGYVYVTSSSEVLYLIPPMGGTGSISNTPGYWGINYDSSNGYMYAANPSANIVSVISGTTVIANISIPRPSWSSSSPAPIGVAYDPSDNYMYVSDINSSSVTVINGMTVLTNIQVPLSGPNGISFDPANGYVYVADSRGNTISIISGTQVIGSVTVCCDPTAMVYDPEDSSMYVATSLGPIFLVNGSQVEAQIPVSAAGLAYDPASGSILVASPSSGKIVTIGYTLREEISFYREYLVIFSESGLALGTNWHVTLNSSTESSSSSTITFAEPNGSFGYTIAPINGYMVPSSSSGTVTVSGKNVSLTINFVPLASNSLLLSVAETGAVILASAVIGYFVVMRRKRRIV